MDFEKYHSDIYVRRETVEIRMEGSYSCRKSFEMTCSWMGPRPYSSEASRYYYGFEETLFRGEQVKHREMYFERKCPPLRNRHYATHEQTFAIITGHNQLWMRNRGYSQKCSDTPAGRKRGQMLTVADEVVPERLRNHTEALHPHIFRFLPRTKSANGTPLSVGNIHLSWPDCPNIQYRQSVSTYTTISVLNRA